MAAKGKEAQVSYRQRLVAMLMSLGVKQSQAARMVGVRPEQVTRWKKNQAFAAYLARRMEEVESRVEGARDILIEGAPMAALKILDLLDSEDEGIQIRASSDILDRVGVSKTARLEAEIRGELTLKDLVTKAKEDGESE